MSDIFTTGFEYKKFKVLKVFDVPDYHSKAVYLRHEKTGLEVVHLFNDDTENLFAFAFRTPNPKSNGAAHIIEHSVLCGSEKFPLKDPFVTMSNQSVKTYLNAMTYPDKTIYPASSIAKEDYFNLMDVYGDAVFFPKLQKEIFMQEAHRLEVDKNGKVSIQGVVYNEMKGNYSSFDSVANDTIALSLLKNSVYQKDSGGDPLEIPSITYEDFKAFHKKWYRADNCLVFLYGNIPTAEQLDFLQEKFLDRIEARNPDFVWNEKVREKNLDEFLSFVKSDSLLSPAYDEYEGPVSESETKSTVLVSWDLGNVEDSRESAENVVLAGILANHDGSPFQKALIESSLGEDIAPQSGFSNSFYNKIFTVGLRGVKKSDARKVEKVVLETLEKIVKNGVSKKDIETTLMGLEISQREIKRASGPFSLALMVRLASGWIYGYDVSNQIRSRKVLEEIKKKIETSDKYLENLIRAKFLENKSRSLNVVTPSKNYSKKREEAEKKIISAALKSTSIEKIKSENEKLHEFQQSAEDESCLPHLHPADFLVNGRPLMNRGDLSVEEVESFDGKKIEFLVSQENTNGMIYFDLAYPVDTLPAEDYEILPVFSDCVTECGWKNLGWAAAAEETALHAGGIGAHLLTMDSPDTEISRKFCSGKNWTKRDWIIYSTFMIEEECGNALKLLSDCVSGVSFDDLKRIRDIVNESKNDFESSVIPDGHIYVSSRVCSLNSEKSAVDEIWNGLTQLGAVRKIVKKSDEELSKIFKNLHEKIRKSGAILHVTAEKSGIEKVRKYLGEFIEKTEILEIKPPRENKFEDFKKVINSEFDSSDSKNFEVFTAETQVGFAADSIPAAPYGTKDCAADEVCSHWLTNNILWEKIRTIGGAYGSFCTPENFGELMIFATYRDPNPLNSCEVFEKSIEECAEMDFAPEEVEKAVMGCYSHFIQPQTPKSRGTVSFTRALYGILDEDREQKIKWLLEINSDDVKKAFKRLCSQMKNPKCPDKIRKAVLCGKSSIEKSEKEIKKNGKIFQLSL